MRIGPLRIAELACAALFAAGCFAQTTTRPQTRDITLLEGRGELISFPQDVTKVAISEPKIADAVVISPREVMINAKGPGRATMVIWETGADPSRYEINVTKDTTEWDAFAKAINDAAGGAYQRDRHRRHHRAQRQGEIRRGCETPGRHGADARQDRDQPAAIAAAAEPRQILLQVKFAAIDRVALTQIGFNLFSTNPKMIGTTTTEQFTPPRFSQLQSTGHRADGELLRPAQPFRVSPGPEHRRHHQGACRKTTCCRFWRSRT